MLLIENRRDDKKLFVKSLDSYRRVLWEFESRCNLKCKYCYDSRVRNIVVSEQTVRTIVEKLNCSDVEYVHVTGGEPTINPYLEYVVRSLKDKKICITTNLVEISERIQEIFFQDNVYSIAVSLDSVDMLENDFLRGATLKVLENIQRLLEHRTKITSKTKIRIHSVISKVNINSLEKLLEWATYHQIDEVSCQPISLSPGHPYEKLLSLSADDLPQIQRILQKEWTLFDSKYAKSHGKLLNYYLDTPECFTKSGRELCHPFIDAEGIIWNCPRKLYAIDSFEASMKDDECCDITPQCMCCLKRHQFAEL